MSLCKVSEVVVVVDDKTAAFLLFLNASAFGHVEAAVQAAWYLSTGHLPGVSRDEERAVM